MFEGCTNLVRVELPEDITNIPPYSFQDCNSLREIRIPVSVTSIEYSAFENCTSLETIALPEGLRTIDSDAFRGCIKLRGIKLPDGLQRLGDSPFDYCESLEEMMLPASLIEVGFCVCMGCSSLKRVSIPKGVLPNNFMGCYNIEEIYLYEPSPDANYIYFEPEVKENAILYVPVGSKAIYEAHEEYRFHKHIVEFDPTAILSTKAQAKASIRYNLAGQKVDANYKGIVIENGKKMMVK